LLILYQIHAKFEAKEKLLRKKRIRSSRETKKESYEKIKKQEETKG